MRHGSRRRGGGRIWLGLMVAVIGALIWLGNLDLIRLDMGRHWPVLLILLGLGLIIGGASRRHRRPNVSTGGPDRATERGEILGRLEQGEISAEEAAERLRRPRP